MTLSQLSAPLRKEQAYALVDAVMERDDLAVTATAYEDPDTGEWVFEATCDSRPDVESFAELARRTLGGTVEFSVIEIDPEVNWVEKSLAGLQPVIAGGFYVHGSHDEGPVPAGLTGILIDAAEAFGTGHHETTTGCLEAIETALDRRRYRAMLDVGTGTGVLAIALAKRTQLPVIASDIDPVAVRTTEENARNNAVGALVVAVEAAGLEHQRISSSAPYDLIVANILAAPLIELAPPMARMAEKGGSIILSGILVSQAPRVISAYAEQRLVVRRKLIRGDWVTLVMEKL